MTSPGAPRSQPYPHDYGDAYGQPIPPATPPMESGLQYDEPDAELGPVPPSGTDLTAEVMPAEAVA